MWNTPRKIRRDPRDAEKSESIHVERTKFHSTPCENSELRLDKISILLTLSEIIIFQYIPNGTRF